MSPSPIALNLNELASRGVVPDFDPLKIAPQASIPA
jgi:hypothetical protein